MYSWELLKETHLDPGGQAGEDPGVGGEAGLGNHEAVQGPQLGHDGARPVRGHRESKVLQSVTLHCLPVLLNNLALSAEFKMVPLFT